MHPSEIVRRQVLKILTDQGQPEEKAKEAALVALKYSLKNPLESMDDYLMEADRYLKGEGAAKHPSDTIQTVPKG